ncbi:hypothetical protein WJX77_010947 [Trebouxia sp. C0004]
MCGVHPALLTCPPGRCKVVVLLDRSSQQYETATSCRQCLCICHYALSQRGSAAVSASGFHSHPQPLCKISEMEPEPEHQVKCHHNSSKPRAGFWTSGLQTHKPGWKAGQ